MPKLPTPFDPVRLANWYGGIARAMRDHELDWAPVDALISRTLRGMGILTRQSRREVISNYIRKAIRSLINKGVLQEYRPGRVRISDPARMARYATSLPEPWPNGEGIRRRDEFKMDVEEASFVDSSADVLDGLPPSTTSFIRSPVALPLFSALDSEDADGRSTDEVATTVENDGYTPEESAALDTLLGGKHPVTSLSRTDSTASRNSLGQSEAHRSQALMSVQARLVELAPECEAAIADGILRVQIGRANARLETRRDGSMRAAIQFPQSMLMPFLRQSRLLWYAAPVGVDGNGLPAILRIWHPPIDPATVAHQIIEDIQFIEDVESA